MTKKRAGLYSTQVLHYTRLIINSIWHLKILGLDISMLSPLLVTC